MRLKSFCLVVAVTLIALAANVSAQDRTIGARRLLLDDGTNTAAGLIFLTDNNGSLGVDLNGNVTGSFPSTCALLDLSSTTKGFLVPRMTTAQELGICAGTPPEGLMVYNLTTHTLDVYNGLAWGPIAGWTLRGNSIALGGTGAGGSYIGTNTAQDYVIATNGVERSRYIGVAGPNQGFLGLGTVSPNRQLEVFGVSGTPSARFGSLSGVPLVAPPLNPATDGIVMANTNGDINKYNTGFVIGTFGWLRTGNTILDGNNILGSLNDIPVLLTENSTTVMTLGTVAQGQNVGIKTAPGANWPLTVGAGAGSNSTLDLGNEQVNGTFNSQGNSTVGTNAATTNSLGNNGASTNNIGNGAGATNNMGNGGGATFNTIGISANTNNIGSFAGTNDFGNSAGTNFIGNATGAVTTSNQIGIGFAGATITNIIGSNSGSVTNSIVGNTASAITLDVSNTANNLILNNINNAASDVNFLTLSGANSGNVRSRTLASFITGSNGVEVTYVAGVADAHFGPLNTSVPFTSNRFVNLNASNLNFTSNAGALNPLVITGGAAPTISTLGTTNINNTGGATTNIASLAAATTNIGMLGGTNTIAGTTTINNNVNNNTSINTGTSTGLVTIGNTASSGATSINSSVSNTITAPANTMTASATTNTIGAATTNNITGGTGNTITATTGNNVLAATVGNNNLNANGAASQNNLTSTATGSNNISGPTNINTTVASNTAINTFAGAGNTQVGATNHTGTILLASNAPGSSITLDVSNVVGNNLTLNNIAPGANTDAAFLDLTTIPSGNVRTRTIGSLITGSNGVEVTYTGSSADAHFGPLNTSVPFATDRFINAAAFTLRITNSTPADFVTFNGSNNAVNINNTTVGTNNIGNGGGATQNLIGTNANNNQIGFGAVQNNIGQIATTNFFGFNATTNNFGTGIAGTNNFGTGSPLNNMGTSGTSTNTILGATNINVTGGNTTQIATTTAATTAIGVLGGTNTIAGSTTINNSVNNTTGINTGTSTGNVTIGNATAGSGTTTIRSNAGGNANSIVLDVTAAATNNLQFLNIAADAAPTQWLTLNAANQVRTTTIAGTALEGIVFTAGAYRLGSTLTTGAGSDPFLVSRNVNLDASNLSFTSNNGALTPVQIIGGATPKTIIGVGTSAHQLEIKGVQDATGVEALASPVWDLAVTGDIAASGMIKSGASLVLDGFSPIRRLISDNALTVSTDLAGPGTGGNLNLSTSGNGALINMFTSGNGSNIAIGSTGAGNGSVDISTVGSGNISLETKGGGNLSVGPNTAGGTVSLSNNGANPVTISTQTGALTIQSAGGSFNIQNTTQNIALLTTGNANITLNSSGGGNTQVGTSLTVGALSAPTSTLDIRGSINTNVVTDAGALHNTSPTDYIIIMTAAGSTVNLPAVVVAGRVVIVKNRSAGNVNVATAGPFIDGAASPYPLLGANSFGQFVGDNGGNWILIAK